MNSSLNRVIATILCVAAIAAGCSSTQSDIASTSSTPAPSATVEPPATTETTTVTPTTPTTDENSGGSTVPDSAFATNRLSTIDANLEGALFGISTGLTRVERAERFPQLEADAGRQFDIGHVFHAWDQPIPTEADLQHIADGRILMISWNGTDTIEIQDGIHDEWIAEQAGAVRDLGEPVMMRWLWEMDGNRRREWVHSPEDFVAAWLQVRSIFNEVGATNAQFVWCPNEFLFWEGGDPDPWYPGDEHVDWLCADGYNWAETVDSPEWISFDEIFEDFVSWAAPRNKPIVIGETGAGEAEPGAKAEWLASLPGILRTELPEIDAVVYFDKDFTDFGHRDWRVDTSPETYDAWIEVSRDPWLNP